MQHFLVCSLCAILVVSAAAEADPLTKVGDEVIVDGVRTSLSEVDLGPARSQAPATDVVGGTTSSAAQAGRAKGNSYRVDSSVLLTMAQYYLNFSDTQTLTFYVFQSPVEFGTY